MARTVKGFRLALFLAIAAAIAPPAIAGPIETGKFALTDDLEKSVILVATRRLVDRVYGRTVLFATPLKGAHFGFILNRPSKLTLGVLFPAHEPSKGVKEPVYFGGPEMSQAIMAVTEGSQKPNQTAFPLDKNLFMTSRGNEIDSVIERISKGEIGNTRFFAGFVVWEPGELQAEIKKGAWHVLDVPLSEFFFHEKKEKLWETLIDRVEMKAKAI